MPATRHQGWWLGVGDGCREWLAGQSEGAVTERVGKGVAWMPFHFGGWFGGEDLRSKYPEGTDPVVLGESANTITTYGYDPATGMQEPKVTLCQSFQRRRHGNGSDEVPLRRRPLYRVQRLRHCLQKRKRGAVGHQSPPRRHDQ